MFISGVFAFSWCSGRCLCLVFFLSDVLPFRGFEHLPDLCRLSGRSGYDLSSVSGYYALYFFWDRVVSRLVQYHRPGIDHCHRRGLQVQRSQCL